MKVKDLIKNSTFIKSIKHDTYSPEISVILPTYRRFKNGYFERCVDSILNQTFNNIELIIIDDCSFDGTFERIKKYIDTDYRVSCIRHSYNIGLPVVGTYEAFCKSRGKYISFIFDDGEYTVNALETLINKSKKYKKDVVC
ncbi:MAG: glycosyltransferase family 2 protein, partial [Desulfovibrio sp.]|nr:glycosyltransferase family 2 protein [Desulfovibrio sp.]